MNDLDITTLFRIPFTIYWVCRENTTKLLCIGYKKFNEGNTPPYVWRYLV